MTKARLVVILCTLTLGCLLVSQAEAAKDKLTPEEYVRRQVEKGEEADLLKNFVLPHMARERRGLASRSGLTVYLSELEESNPKKKEEFLKKYGKDLRIRAVFLEKLLTGALGKNIHRKGVMIKNAIITEPLDLRLAEVPFEVSLSDCDFWEKVDFRDTRFGKNLRLNRCHFAEKAHFLKMTVKKSVYLEGAVFKALANFEEIDIGDSLKMDFIRFKPTTVVEEIDVGEGSKIRQVNFNGSTIGSNFFLRWSTIIGPANFMGMEVGSDLFLEKTMISEADFTGADIGHDLIAEEAHFLGPSIRSKNSFDNYAAIFVEMKVGNVANFEKAVFTDQVNFSRMDVGLQLEADEAKFESEEQPVKAIGLKVGTIAYFQDGEFKGPVDFTAANIKGIFNATGAKFRSKSEAIFRGMNVGQLAQFTNAEFRGSVNFSNIEVGSELITEVEKGTILEGAVFGDDETPGQVLFTDATLTDLILRGSGGTPLRISTLGLKRLRVTRDFSLENAIIDDLKAGTLQVGGDLSINTAWVDNFEAANLTVEGNLSIKTARANKLRAENLVVDGIASFEKFMITRKADLSYCSLDTFKMDMDINKDWPPKHIERQYTGEWMITSLFDVRNHISLEKLFANKGYQKYEEGDRNATKEAGLILDGLEYKELLPRETHADRAKLNDWINHGRFDVENYIRLEKYFASRGYEQEADEVYISMKDQELAQMAWYNPGRWLIWLLWGKMAGYGHKPFRIFWVALGIILAGAIFVFNPKYLQVRYFQNWHLNYTMTPIELLKKGGDFFQEIRGLFKLWLFRFVISFDQFIPLIDLELAKNWQPPHLSFRAWFFMYFQKISGWILVPIGLAAIYSQFQ